MYLDTLLDKVYVNYYLKTHKSLLWIALIGTCDFSPFYFRHKDAIEMINLVLNDPRPERIKFLPMH